MKMQELPVEVQAIAASTLRRKMKINDQRADKEPVEKLAHEVREAFTQEAESVEKSDGALFGNAHPQTVPVCLLLNFIAFAPEARL